MEQAAWGFGFLQPPPVLAILCERHLADLLQQIILTLSQEQDLALTKVSQFTSGFPTTDTALMATKSPKQRLEHQVVWR
jgi:hypothetical protein